MTKSRKRDKLESNIIIYRIISITEVTEELNISGVK